MRATDKLLAKLLMREAGIPTPPFHALREESIKELGAAAAVERIQRGHRPAAGGQAGAGRLGAGGQVRPRRRGAAESDGRGVLV